MKDTIQQLIDLQVLDSEILKLANELTALPRELSHRDGDLRAKQKEVEDAHKSIQTTRVRIKEIETEIKTIEAKIAKLDGEANSVRDNAQLFAIQHQIKTFQEEISKKEDEALNLYSEVEQIEVKEKKLKEELGGIEEEFRRFKKNVDDEIATVRKKKAEWEAKRKEVVPSIQAEMFEKYSRLLDARSGQAMAPVQSQICQGCFMQVIPNDYVKLLNGKVIIHCRHCTRILYIPREGS